MIAFHLLPHSETGFTGYDLKNLQNVYNFMTLSGCKHTCGFCHNSCSFSVGTMRSRRYICVKGFQGCCPDKRFVSSCLGRGLQILHEWVPPCPACQVCFFVLSFCQPAAVTIPLDAAARNLSKYADPIWALTYFAKRYPPK